MKTRLAILAAAWLVATGCVPGPSPSPSEPTVAVPIVLRTAPANLGCEAIGTPYRVVTFKIDAHAIDQVTATADTGAKLHTFWSAGFRGGSSDDPVVRDLAGLVVVADGDVLQLPDAAWPRLAGYFVCPSRDALYVLIEDPT